MKVLELYSGTECMSNAFRKRGHECYTVDWDEKFPSSWHTDVGEITPVDIVERFGRPDVIWIGTDCTTYSVAAISHHRKRNPENGNLDPITDYAEACDERNKHCLWLIEQLKPKYWFIENPRGGLRSMSFMRGLPRYTITYCQYGGVRDSDGIVHKYMKPTDIWTNHPDPKFKPPCHNGDPCHEKAPRGSKHGAQAMKGSVERSKYPEELCEHIVDICEETLKMDIKTTDFAYSESLVSRSGSTVYFYDCSLDTLKKISSYNGAATNGKEKAVGGELGIKVDNETGQYFDVWCGLVFENEYGDIETLDVFNVNLEDSFIKELLNNR